ncbi:MAG: AAA family ATPase [Rhodopirellula sp.]|nr:AAA family ATPase [Rhodopirellula sp.]
MSNASSDNSNSASREKLDANHVAPAGTSAVGSETVARLRGEEEVSGIASSGIDVVIDGADADGSSFSQSAGSSNEPRHVTFRSDRGIVPLTGIERLQQIACQLQDIDAPGILKIQSVDELEDGCRVVMEPVSGVTLEQLLKTRRPSWLESLRIIAHVTEALIPVHKEKLAHGNLHPSRIFLRNLQLTKLADFALCLVSGQTVLTDHASLACVAPENVDNAQFPLTPQMDVYGIGVVLYRLICGRYPFRSEIRSEVQRQIREDAPQPPRQLAPDIPSELEQLCLKCLAKNPADRPASAHELSTTFNRLIVNYEKAAEKSSTDSLSLNSSQRLTSRRPAAIRRAMLICVEPRDGLLLDTLAAALDQVGVPPEPWSGDGLLFSLPSSNPNSDWTVPFSDRVLRCLRAVAKEQRASGTPSDVEAPAVTLRAFSVRLHSRPDPDQQPVSPDSMDRQVLQLEATIAQGAVEICHRGYELLMRSLPCDESKFDTESPGIGQFRIADRDGGTLKVYASRFRNQLPLSGRNSQFAILKSRWHQACEGMGQIVLLIGDEGMGKTRMVWELVTHVATPENADVDNARAIVWNCRPFQQGQSLHPLLNWLRHSHEDFDDDDDNTTINARIEELLKSADTSVSEPGSVLGSELGVRNSSYGLRTSLSATQRLAQSCQILIDWLKGQARKSPLLLVIEDLQWVDPATLNFLTLLIEGGFSDRIMTLLTFRSDFETPWGSRAHQTQVALSRLTRRHAKTLIEAASGRTDVSDELVEEVLKRTDGIPLYIEADAANPASDLFRDAGQ